MSVTSLGPQQGFMLGIDPQLYTLTQAHEQEISLALKNALQKAVPPMQIPKFVVAFCTPQITVGTTVVRTKACWYAIETEEKAKAPCPSWLI